MPKSIHQRVRAQLEKKAREEKRAAAFAQDKVLRALERVDLARERGVERYIHGEELGRNASRAEREGYASAERADMALDFREWPEG